MTTGYPDETYYFHHHKQVTCSVGALLCPCSFTLGGGNSNPLLYSCLENPMDRETWWATVHGIAKSQTRLSDWSTHHSFTSHLPLPTSFFYESPNNNKKKSKQSVSLFYKPCILIYSSFLKHTILEFWPEVIFVFIFI